MFPLRACVRRSCRHITRVPARKQPKKQKSAGPDRDVMAKAAARFDRADKQRAAVKSDPAKAVEWAKARFGQSKK
jgi:hypothetical protein